MANRKKRPILYEKVRRTRRSRDSGWQAPTPPTNAESLEGGVPGGRPVPAARRRSFRFQHGRLLIELGWPGLTVAGVAAVLVLAVAFQAGVRYAQSSPAGAMQPLVAGAAEPAANTEGGPDTHFRAAGRQPAVTPAAAQRGPATPAAAQPAEAQRPASFEFRKGYHYVVIQHFRRSHEQTATEAARFVREHGINCVLERGADVRVIATEAFLLDQSDARARSAERSRCETLNTRIREIGKEFAKHQRTAGKPEYAFDQSYPQLRTR